MKKKLDLTDKTSIVLVLVLESLPLTKRRLTAEDEDDDDDEDDLQIRHRTCGDVYEARDTALTGRPRPA